ncbi:MAG TPA: RNA polymerase sigma factor [Patescibacteria group bacterium]|nr:RNA polymerase sigma factor [Patescibacteria group bacterium]
MENSKSDEEVAILVQAGEVQAFGVLVERYEQKMLRYAHKFLFGYQDGEDVVQEVFLKAFTNIQGFDSSRKFSSWLYRIAHNEFINAIKKKRREPLPFFDPDTIFPHPVAQDDPVRDLNTKQMASMLNQSLDKLDPKYREALVLYYFEDLDYGMIAEILQIPKSTVGVRILRGKEFLKKIYNEVNHHE